MRPDHSIGIRRNPFKRSASLRRATHRGCRCSFCGRKPRRPEAPEAVFVDCKTPPLWIDRNTKQRGSSEMRETKQQVQLLAKRFFWSQPQFPIYLPPLLCHLTEGSLKEDMYLPAILPQMSFLPWSPTWVGYLFGLPLKQQKQGVPPQERPLSFGGPQNGWVIFWLSPPKNK